MKKATAPKNTVPFEKYTDGLKVTPLKRKQEPVKSCIIKFKSILKKIKISYNNKNNKFLYYYEPMIPKFYSLLAKTILIGLEFFKKCLLALLLLSFLMLFGVSFTFVNYLSCLSVSILLPLTALSYYKLKRGDY